jgi:hypothetical protein
MGNLQWFRCDQCQAEMLGPVPPSSLPERSAGKPVLFCCGRGLRPLPAEDVVVVAWPPRRLARCTRCGFAVRIIVPPVGALICGPCQARFLGDGEIVVPGPSRSCGGRADRTVKRPSNTDAYGRPFDPETIDNVWRKGPALRGDLPDFVQVFRLDVCGKLIARADYGRPTSIGWEVDHIIPVARGGTDDLTNLQPLYWQTNRAKGNAYPWGCPDGVHVRSMAELEQISD